MQPFDAFRQKAIQALSGLSYLIRRQQIGKGSEFLLEVAPLVRLEAGAGLDTDAEHVHDLARRGPLGALRERVDIARPYIQAKG